MLLISAHAFYDAKSYPLRKHAYQVQEVDRDGSGEICFQEFLAVFQLRQGKNAPPSSSVVQPRSKRDQGNAIEKLVTLQGVKDVSERGSLCTPTFGREGFVV